MRLALSTLFCVLLATNALAIRPDKKRLPKGFAPHEIGNVPQPDFPRSPAPVAPIRSLGEWEDSDFVMTLWKNSSLVREMASRTNVKLFADSKSDENWWKNWVRNNNIHEEKISYFVAQTNSIWIRDYGPWFILDGNHEIGMVDNIYNRPRPLDDVIPQFLTQAIDIPLYETGLVHTGGNYYSDGMSNAFSSTLVYTENRSLEASEVQERMKEFLGIDDYITSRLAPGITIEHLDTFGKLVAPDTWVFSQFPVGSRFRSDSENMHALLKTLTSPYGTPYKILRMPMVRKPNGSSESFRAYINSFISNRVLYFPVYDDSIDDDAKAIYQTALPGYEIVGVDADGTSWGDSVHCRTRNIMKADTVFIFPQVVNIPSSSSDRAVVKAEIIPSPGKTLVKTPQLSLYTNGTFRESFDMQITEGSWFEATLPALEVGTSVSFYITAEDSAGIIKTAPVNAPDMTVDFIVE